jgi:hypothetical protein
MLKRKEKVTTRIEVITPGDAQEMLSRNTNNRSLRKSLVSYYAKQMKNGEWVLNGEAIKIASDGTLIDGQHRLDAISKSGLAQEMFVVRGLDKGSFYTIDVGKKRSHADHLKIAGIKSANPGILAAAVRTVVRFDRDGVYLGFTDKMTPQDCIDFVEKHPGLAECTYDFHQKKISPILAYSLAVALKYVFSFVDAEKSEEFFTKLQTGADLKQGSPILTLRNKIVEMRGPGSGSIVTSFNCFVEGKSRTVLRHVPGSQIQLKGFNPPMDW